MKTRYAAAIVAIAILVVAAIESPAHSAEEGGGTQIESCVDDPDGWRCFYETESGMTFADCVTEDDENDCYWDATKRGNGLGRSFMVIDGEVYYTAE